MTFTLPRDRLFPLVDNLARARVLVVGDIILDRFIYGDVHRLSSEAPVPILNITRENAMPGGAGNTLANLATLGAKVSIVAGVGDDEAGQTLKSYLGDMAINAAGLVTFTDTRQTSVKIRYMAGTQQILCVHDETLKPVPTATEEKLLAAIDQALTHVDCMILSDYGRGVMTPAVIRGATTRAKARGVRVLVDPRSSDFTLYNGADIVTPNRKELSLATGGMPLATDADIEKAGQFILAKTQIGALVITRAQDGLSIIQKDHAPIHIPAQARAVFDVSGAGDTVIATLACALAAGVDLPDAATIANLAGGIVVGKVGTAKIYPADLKEALAGTGTARYTDKIMTWEQTADCVARLRAQGKKIGFTNGCFDILHQGHAAYLQEAAQRCDYLIVGVNADTSVKRLKGEGRPYNNESSRAEVLAALQSVAAVVVFGNDPADGDTAARVITALKPDIYFKAGDYTPESLPETPSVRAVGGRVEIMPFVEGYSTSATLARLRANNKSAA